MNKLIKDQTVRHFRTIGGGDIPKMISQSIGRQKRSLSVIKIKPVTELGIIKKKKRC